MQLVSRRICLPHASQICLNWDAALVSCAPLVSFRVAVVDSHLTLLGREACSECHNVRDPLGVSTREAPDPDELWDRSHFHARTDFLDMTKRKCAECHKPVSGIDSCVTCHNYHDVLPRPAAGHLIR